MLVLYPHNQKAYENAKFIFETEDRTAIVHPTGTGKSLIIAKFIIENPNSKILFLSPNIFIHNELKKHLKGFSKNVVFQTFQYFLFNTINSFTGFDFIFIDEFHRAGAKEWSKQVQELFSINPKAKILGTTATHIRYLDDEKNMADELFNGNISSYLSLGEAIEHGIHKKPIYVSALYNIREILDDTENRLKRNNKKKELENLKSRKIIWEESNGIDFIISKYLNQNRKKIIVFCKSIEHFQYIEALLIPVLSTFFNGNVHFSKVHSQNDGNKNFKIFNNFENSNIPQVLFSVDMLNEGIHVKGVDTVMMFRDTISPIIYFQQMGRAFTAGQKYQPLIFDFVNNFNVKNSISSIVSNFYNDFQLINETNFLTKRNVIIDFYDETLDFQNFINEFSRFKSFEANLEDLRHFIATNNKFPTSKELKWIYVQRDRYRQGKLTQEKINAISEIDQNFLLEEKPEIKTLSFEENLEDLKQFIAANNKFPASNEFRWIYVQRQVFRQGKLSQERIKAISEIDKNFLLEEKPEIKTLSFEENLEDLKQFIATNNKFPKRKEFRWIYDQRNFFREGKLSQERIKAISEIDKNFLLKDDLYTQQWDNNIEEWKKFLTINKRNPTTTENFWIHTQRRNFRQGKLSQERIKAILEIDQNFLLEEKPKIKTLSFEENLEDLKQLIATNNKFPTSNEFRWIYVQRDLYREGKLSKMKINAISVIDQNFLFKKKKAINNHKKR